MTSRPSDYCRFLPNVEKKFTLKNIYILNLNLEGHRKLTWWSVMVPSTLLLPVVPEAGEPSDRSVLRTGPRSARPPRVQEAELRYLSRKQDGVNVD